MQVKLLILLIIILLGFILMGKFKSFFNPLISFTKVFIYPLTLAVFISYMLKPLNKFFMKKGIKDWISSLICLVILFLVIGILSSTIFMTIVADIENFAASASSFKDYLIQSQYVNNALGIITNYISIDTLVNFVEILMVSTIAGIGSVFSIVKNIGYSLSFIIFFLVMLFYILKDGHKFKPLILRTAPKKYNKVLEDSLNSCDRALSAYVIGQGLIALSLAIMMFIGFKIVGIHYAASIGLITFMLSLIPFIGFFIAMIIAYIVTIPFGLFGLISLTILIIIVQIIKNRFVAPYVLGEALNIHPLTILALVILALSYFGVIGALLVIPLYSCIKIFIKNIYFAYLKKKKAENN